MFASRGAHGPAPATAAPAADVAALRHALQRATPCALRPPPRALPAHPLCTIRPAAPRCATMRSRRRWVGASRASAAGGAEGDAADAEDAAAAPATPPQKPQPQPARTRLRTSQLRRGGVLCTDAQVLGMTRLRGSKGVRAGGVVYVEAPDGSLAPLTARDVRGSAERLRSAFAGLLLPEGGVAAVTPDYWHWTKYNFIRTAVSATGAVLGTRALLRAIGVGGASAAAGSAALNWVLKDGLGRLGAIIAASAIGNKFDNDAKTFFLYGDLCYELGVGIELCSPLFPTWFLLVGSIANALKSTSYMMRLPPRAAFLKSFARRENVGDLSAKANAQEVVAGMLGMGLGIALSTAIGDVLLYAYCAYAVTLSTVAACSYASLRGLRVATLNWARMRILLRGYMRSGGSAAVPGPREVNAREPMPSWLLGRRGNASEWTMPVRYGAPLNQTAPTSAALRRLAALYAGERYLLSVAPPDAEGDAPRGWRAWLPRRRRRTDIRICVTVTEDSAAHDALLAMLQAARLQALLQEERGDGHGRVAPDALLDEAYRWDVLERSYRSALAEAPRLSAAMRTAGWNTNVVLWTPTHVADWSMAVPDPQLRCPLPAPPAAQSEGGTEGAERRAGELRTAALAEAAEDLEAVAWAKPSGSA